MIQAFFTPGHHLSIQKILPSVLRPHRENLKPDSQFLKCHPNELEFGMQAYFYIDKSVRNGYSMVHQCMFARFGINVPNGCGLALEGYTIPF